MPKERRTIVTDLKIVGIGVEPDAGAFRHQKRALVRQKLAAVDHHALIALAMAGDAAILGARDEAIAKMIGRTRRWQQHGAAIARTLEIHLREHHSRHVLKAAA